MSDKTTQLYKNDGTELYPKTYTSGVFNDDGTPLNKSLLTLQGGGTY